MRRLAVSLFALAVGIWGTADAATRFGEESFTLKNGLQVVVIPNHRAPTVSHWVWYKVGSSDEERGHSGAAHFLEHLMFKGTKTVKPKEFSVQVERQGGQENAFTSWDYTAYFQTVAADRLELVMKLESDRMQNLVLDDAELKPERDVVMEEWRMRTGNQPAALLDQQVEAALYLNNPYRIPVLGWPEEIKKLDVPTEKRFYDTWYAPNNAVLIVAGDVTVDQVRTLAERYYGVIPAHPVPERVHPAEPERSADALIVLKHDRVRAPRWSRHYLAPTVHAGDTKQAFPLEILADVLGGGSNSRLHKSLVLDQKIATAAGVGYGLDRFDLGSFGLYVTPRPGVAMEKVASAVEAEIAKLLKDGVTADEVEKSKTRMINDAEFELDSLTAPVEIIGRVLTTGGTLADVDGWADHVKAVTPEQVMAAAKAVLEKKTAVTGHLLPPDGVDPASLANLPPVPPPSGEIR